jgi:NAD(P)H-dependent FMN reductase
MYNLKIIIGSTRPGRRGPAVASWFIDCAKKYPDFNVEKLDLAEINLPMFDEPNHPRLKQYMHEHTKNWSKLVDSADAFVFVTPEYNYSFPASIKNAIDFLHNEWGYKPVGFVSYGGISAGTRAIQSLKLVVTTLRMVPIFEAVSIPFYSQYIDENGKFNANDSMNRSADALLKELLRWTGLLKEMREG